MKRRPGLRQFAGLGRGALSASMGFRVKQVQDSSAEGASSRMAGALTISLFITGLVLVVNAATGLILARSLGPRDRGVIAAVMIAPFLVVGVGQLGITDALTVYAASGGDLGLAEGTIGPLAAGYGALLTIVVALVGFGFGLAYGHSAALWLSLLFVAPSLWSHWLAYYANGRGDVLHLNLIWLGNVLLTLIGFVILIALHALTVTAVISVYVLATWIVAIWATAYFVANRQLSRSFSWPVVRTWLSFGIRSNISGTADVINQYVDQLVIATVLPSQQLGLYAVAVSLTAVTGIIGTAMTYAVLPAITGARNIAEQKERSVRALLVAAVLAAAATTVLLIFTPYLVRVLFGRAYEPAGRVARTLLIGTGFLSVNSVLMATLKGMHRPQDAGLAQVFGCAVTIGLLFVLLPRYGIEGAAITSAVAYASVTVVLGMLWRRAIRRAERTELYATGTTA